MIFIDINLFVKFDNRFTDNIMCGFRYCVRDVIKTIKKNLLFVTWKMLTT